MFDEIRTTIDDELRAVGEIWEEKKRLREVKAWQLIVFFFLPLILLPTAIFGAIHALSFIQGGRIALFTVFIALSYAFARLFAIGCIYFYKAFAPMSVRDQCRFEPSCSSYTLISVARYGLILGILLGCIRITRCRPPYGGEDPPKLRHILRLFRKCEPRCVNKEN